MSVLFGRGEGLRICWTTAALLELHLRLFAHQITRYLYLVDPEQPLQTKETLYGR
jgi:hypothetical protein